MPWVRLDDRFPSHRKVALLPDRAFRLYISALCWSSENLTEGKILDSELPVIARIRGIKAAAKELESAGLWDRAGDGWAIHDYLEYNPDRARVQAERAANTARQQAWRDRKRAEREARKAAEEAARNAIHNDVTNGPEERHDSTTATRRRHDGDTTAQETGVANQSPSQVSEFRNGVNNGTPKQASPSPSPKASPPEKPASSTAGPPHPSASPPPDACAPLIASLVAVGIVVSWSLGPDEWAQIEARIDAYGVPKLVDFIVRRRNASNPPNTGRYLLRMWSDLPVITADPVTDEPEDQPGGTVLHLRTAPALQATGTDARVAGWLSLPTED